MKRRDFFALIGLGLGLVGFQRDVPAADTSLGAASTQPGTESPDLATTLKKGLKARRQVEFDFIATVVAKVDSGDLPLDLVQSTFLWARRHRPYPYPYFERGLKDRAAKQGISL